MMGIRVVLYQDKKVEYFLNLKAWKRGLTLQVKPERVVVVAPKSARQRDVQEFVKKHADWVFRKQEHFRNLLASHPPKEFVSGESFSVLGRNYRLQVTQEPGLRRPFCRLEEDRLRVFVDSGVGDPKKTARETLLEFYFQQASEKVNENIRRYAPVLNVAPQKIRIADQKSRWGSCSGKGSLRFNWRLAMTSPSILEYVVIHELCNIKHPNHSE